MSVRMCFGWKTGARIGKNLEIWQDQMAKTLESISKGIENCNGFNRGSQIINYNYSINIFHIIN